MAEQRWCAVRTLLDVVFNLSGLVLDIVAN